MYIYWPREKKSPTKNFGDALNSEIGVFFSGEKVINANQNKNVPKGADVYLVCGSSLTFADRPTIVWGSAVLTPRWNIKYAPKKVHAVRGPITRSYLLNRNIKCPEVYGDPGLLCPLMFRPRSKRKRYRVGIIPHVVDMKSIKEWGLEEGVLLIDITSGFQKVVNQVNACEYILSSSLHGLILADSYGIPNLWVNITGIPMAKGKFNKYHDYFMSIGRKIYRPNNIVKNNIKKVSSFHKSCRSPDLNINMNNLLEACPFNKKEISWKI